MTQINGDDYERAIGIGQRLAGDYFQLFMEKREAVVRFYEPDAVLTWEGAEYKGRMEIMKFLQRLPHQTFQVTSYDVQYVPNTDFFVMIVVTGTVQAPNHFGDFHSTFYCSASRKENKAFIKFQTFDSVSLSLAFL